MNHSLYETGSLVLNSTTVVAPLRQLLAKHWSVSTENGYGWKSMWCDKNNVIMDEREVKV
jgi:hypothetical protein